MSVQRQYLDFELKIDDLGGGRYRATVTSTPLGEGQTSNDFTLPFTDAELQTILAVLAGQTRVTVAERQTQARKFGEALFKTVFAGPIYTVYFSSLDRARSAEGLRIKLDLDDAGALNTLPWEFLRDPAVDYFSLSRTTPLIRYPRKLVVRSRPTFHTPLRILVMVSNPVDLPPVDVQAEWNNLQAATVKLRAANRVEVELLDDASLRTLQRKLREKDYHVFHYIGHSAFEVGQGVLALEDPFGENNAYYVRGEDLARELSEENPIRLVVLNSCQSALEQMGDPFAGIASSIVARGIPAVIAMQNPISEGAARVFSEELYRSIADGLPVDAAVSEARRAISHATNGIEWATPVLYMRSADGMLFQTARRAPARGLLNMRAALGILVIGLIVLAGILLILLLQDEDKPDVKPKPPADLVIERIEVFPPRPAPGEKIAIIVHVKNNSSTPVGPFSYDFREDVLDDNTSFAGTFDTGVAPNASAQIVIRHSYTWWGAFISEVRIDTESKVLETDEFNNSRLSPIVTSDNPFVITLAELPDGSPVEQSIPVDPAVFAAWGFHFEALPGDDPACAGMVPWIIVAGDTRNLGTGLPDDPAVCTDGGIALVVDREDGEVGGVTVHFLVPVPADYHLAVFDGDGQEIDSLTQTPQRGEGELSITSSFPDTLEITRAEFRGPADTPTRITQISLDEP
ncbi:MAG TPA: CHAT domain-containing protein [Aggregatilineaceae bacterium]|nr:CHAT domain-containing protein [Aggregatilineaceae bacterium]